MEYITDICNNEIIIDTNTIVNKPAPIYCNLMVIDNFYTNAMGN